MGVVGRQCSRLVKRFKSLRDFYYYHLHFRDEVTEIQISAANLSYVMHGKLQSQDLNRVWPVSFSLGRQWAHLDLALEGRV